MSWSTTIPQMPRNQAVAAVRDKAEASQIPQHVADLITAELDAMPEDASVAISTYGHQWGEHQTGGEASCHFTITGTVLAKD